MPSHDKLIRTLNGPDDPLPLEQLADYWAKKNVSAIAAIAMRSMLDPVGTVYEVPPLCLVGFESRDARILYQLRLHDAAKTAVKKPHGPHVVEHAIGQHIEDLVQFSRAQFLTALTRESVSGIFQRDEWAR